MNTASLDLPHHLTVLRERMLHPTDYEKAIHYFLDEFAGDTKFLEASEPDLAPHLLAVLTHVASQAVGAGVTFEGARVFRLREHGFYHGNAAFAGRVLLFFYIQEAETGGRIADSRRRRRDQRRAVPGSGRRARSPHELTRPGSPAKLLATRVPASDRAGPGDRTHTADSSHGM